MFATSHRLALARLLVPTALFGLLALPAQTAEVFAKLPSPGTGAAANAASWVTPDGSDSDMYAWDDFTLSETQTITEVRWRGGYAFNGLYGHAVDFRVAFFDSVAGGFQPVITALPEHQGDETVIAAFDTHGNAGESPAGSVGGVLMYDYRFTLPTPVTLQGGVKYWFRVTAAMPGPYPDWGMAAAGFGSHFVYNQGAHMFQSWPNELAFALHAQWADHGLALAGSAGLPMLTGSGDLSAGSNASLMLTSARPLADAWVITGFSVLDAPLKGGTLYPYPMLFTHVNTNAAGAKTVSFVVPAGVPAGLELVSQVWIADPLAPLGYAASNGLTGTTP